MGDYNNVGYKPTNKMNLSVQDQCSVIQDIKNSMQVLSTEDLNSMRNPMYQFMI